MLAYLAFTSQAGRHAGSLSTLNKWGGGALLWAGGWNIAR